MGALRASCALLTAPPARPVCISCSPLFCQGAQGKACFGAYWVRPPVRGEHDDRCADQAPTLTRCSACPAAPPPQAVIQEGATDLQA